MKNVPSEGWDAQAKTAIPVEEAFANGLEAKSSSGAFTVRTGVRTSYLVYRGTEIVSYYHIAQKLIISLNGNKHPSVIQKVNSCLSYLFADSILPKSIVLMVRKESVKVYVTAVLALSAHIQSEIMIQSDPFMVSYYVPKCKQIYVNTEPTFKSMAGIL